MRPFSENSFTKDHSVILASASPRRRELLGLLGINFQIEPALGEEIVTTTCPSEVVTQLSQQKAEEVANRYLKMNQVHHADGVSKVSCDESQNSSQKYLVIGADTVVACGDEILGKPSDEVQAVAMLTLLQGRTHSVFTGVTVYEVDGTVLRQICSFAEETKVTMYPVAEREICAYVATKDPMDKAGAYAIQGRSAVFIKEIQGDYNNVVGLPVARLYQELFKK